MVKAREIKTEMVVVQMIQLTIALLLEEDANHLEGGA